MLSELPESELLTLSTPKLIIGGHSHVVALVGERIPPEPELRELTDHPGVISLDGPWPRDDAYWAALADAARGHDLALVWGGNEHNVCYFFQAAYEFDFLSRQVNKLVPSFQLMPKSRIKRRFQDVSFDELEARLTEITAAGPRRVILVGTPPPKKDSEALRAMIQSEPLFVAWAEHIGEPLADIKITLPHIRLKLWYLVQEMLAEIAARFKIAFIPVPADTQDEEGYLKPMYWRNDVTHANALYGELMLESVMKEFA